MNNHGPVVETRGLVKHYGHVFALDGADFEVKAGEVMAGNRRQWRWQIHPHQGIIRSAHSE